MWKSIVSATCFAAFAAMPFGALAADTYDAYSGCNCITSPAGSLSTVGIVSSPQGQVLVNGVPASDGENLSIGSEVLTGAGSASVTVGATCQQAVGPNSQLLISQPGGTNADLCVQIASNPGAISAPAATVAGAGTGTVVGGALLIAGGIGGIIALTDGDDDDRGSASP